MNLLTFAEHYRLRTRRDDCRDPFIPGKLGHLYDHGTERFGLVFEDPVRRPIKRGMSTVERLAIALSSRGRTLLKRRRKALAAGFQVHQEGDCETILVFDPANQEHARLAIRLVGAKRRRIPSPAQLEAARKGQQALHNRRKALAGAVLAARNEAAAWNRAI